MTIIMKVWNDLSHTKLCLENLLHNTTHPFELILIDNGSDFPTKQYLKYISKKWMVKLIVNNKNLGPGLANIQGFEQSKTDIVCLIDHDVLVPNGWLSRLLSDLSTDKKIKIVSPLKYHETIDHPIKAGNSKKLWEDVKLKYKDHSPYDQFLKYSNNKTIDEFDQIFRSKYPGKSKVLTAPPDFTSSCCILVNANYIKSCGGIADVRFSEYGSEDIDLCWRVGEMGGLVVKSNSVYVHHFHNSGLIANNFDVNLLLRKSNQILYEKWKKTLLCSIGNEIKQGNDIEDYLSSYFIFEPLSKQTTLLEDIEKEYHITLPGEISWNPRHY